LKIQFIADRIADRDYDQQDSSFTSLSQQKYRGSDREIALHFKLKSSKSLFLAHLKIFILIKLVL